MASHTYAWLSKRDDHAVVPQPWSYNPSRWGERVASAVVAAVGAAISGYLGLYQLGLTTRVWDPFFGDQSAQVLRSDVSHALGRVFVVPDALLGALAYGAATILVLAGSTRRWQYRPWLIATFGLVVIPLGLVSFTLVTLQGLVLGAWCSLCLVSAVLSLALVFLAWNEIGSSWLYMRRVRAESRDWRLVWNTFWGRPSRLAAEIGDRMSRGL